MNPRFTRASFNTYSDHSPLIYLVGGDADQTAFLKQSLLDCGYRVQLFAEADTVFRAACTGSGVESPAAVVMDIIFSGDDIVTSFVNDLNICKNAGIPVVVVSVRDDLPARLAAFRAGANHYLTRPVDAGQMVTLLDEMTGRQKTEAYRVLIVDDNQEVTELYDNILGEAGMEVCTLAEPLKTLDAVKGFSPDVVMIDLYMPEVSGPELTAILRDNGFLLPILFISGETDLSLQLQALDHGGDDFIVKPVEPEYLVASVTARAQRSRRSMSVCHRLETALYERDLEHQALNQHAIVSITDNLGNITYANELFCQVSGYTLNELLGQNHRIIKSGLHDAEFYRGMWETILGGEAWHGEVCNRSKDGSLYWMESTITPFLDDTGKPYQYVSIRTDITQNKERERALRAIVDGTITLTGEAFLHKTVQGLAESMGVRFSFIADIDDGDATMLKTVAIWDTDHIIDNFTYPTKGTPCEKVMQNDLCVYLEKVADLFPEDAWLKANGIESYIGIPLFDSNKNFLGHMGVIDEKPLSNVDEKIDFLRIFAASVASELEREQAEAALRASESRLNFLVTSSPVTIYTCAATPPFAASYISPNIKQLLGYEPEQFTEDANFWAGNIHPQDQPQVFDDLPQLFEHGRHQHEYRFCKPDGSYVWMHDEMRLIKNSAGEPVEIAGYWADISERKVTEQLLELNKERLRRGQVFANIGTWDWNIVTGELFWSERIAPLFGYADGELETSYENFINAVHEDDRQAVIDAVGACVEHGTPYDIEHRVTWPDGSVRWLHERGAVVRDAEGKPLQMLGVVQDVDARKRAEQALRESQIKLSGLFELSPLGIALTDMNGNYLEFNEAFRAICGYSAEELKNLDYWALTPKEYEAQEARQLELLKTTGRYGPYEKTYRQKNGHLVPIRLNGMLVEDQDGQQHIWSIVENISESKKAEAVIRDSQQRMALHVQRTPLAVIEWDINFCVNEWNSAAETIFGFTREQALGHHATELIIPDNVIEHAGEVWEQLLTLKGGLRSTNENITRDGSTILCDWYNTPLINDEGKVMGVASLVQDITKQKDAEMALIQAKTEAEYANSAKSEFLSSMSHELRTPMNSILGFSQLLKYDENLSEEQQDHVQEILRAGHHLLNLINEVLDLAKIESGQIELSLEPVEVCRVAEECMSLVATLAAKRDIQISHTELTGAVVRADRTRLKQALINLLSNAIKYNRDGGSVTLEILHQENDQLRILVKDTGIGIADDRLDELFQPFNRLDAEDSEIEGTGIGLTITRRIAEMMGGTVGVQSAEGVGSVFWIELPSELLNRSGNGNVVNEVKGKAQPSMMVEHTILYIEDNPANLRLVTQILAQRKHIQLLTAHTSEIGIELASTHRPELILLDINMPGMNGYQVLEILKADADLKHIPVIAVTANAMLRDIERGKAAGFVDYVTKPVDVVKFLGIVDQCLNTKG